MRQPNWTGFPRTIRKGNCVAVGLRWQSPFLLRYRSSLFRFLFIVSLCFGVYAFLSGWLTRYDPILLATGFLTWLLVCWVGLTACTFRTRVIVFSPHWISFRYRLDNLRLQRALSHGFRLAQFHLPLHGQQPQHGQHGAMMNQQNFYLYLDHPEQTVLLATIAGQTTAELLSKRLINVSSYFQQKFQHEEGMERHRGEGVPQGTFTKQGRGRP